MSTAWKSVSCKVVEIVDIKSVTTRKFDVQNTERVTSHLMTTNSYESSCTLLIYQ
jgi:hypothetical protein